MNPEPRHSIGFNSEKACWEVFDKLKNFEVIYSISDELQARMVCNHLNEQNESKIKGSIMNPDQFERLLEVLALSALAQCQATVLAQAFLIQNSSTQPIQPSTEKIIKNMQAGMNILGARLEVYVKTPLPQ